MMRFRCMLAMLMIAAGTGSVSASVVYSTRERSDKFAPASFHTNVKGDSTIFLYSLNNAEDCVTGQTHRYSSYFEGNSPLFGMLDFSSDPAGNNYVSCFEKQGLKFSGSNVAKSEGGAIAILNGEAERAFIKSKLRLNTETMGFGFEMVWSTNGTNACGLGGEQSDWNLAQVMNLFSIGPALKVAMYDDSSGAGCALMFDILARTVGQTPEIKKNILSPRGNGESTEPLESMHFTPIKNAVNHLSVAVRMKQHLGGQTIKLYVALQLNGNTIQEYKSVTQKGGDFSLLFMRKQDIDQLTIGRPGPFQNLWGNDNSKFKSHSFAGHLHHIGLFALSDNDLTKLDGQGENLEFFTESKARGIAETKVLLFSNQYVIVPLRTEGWGVPAYKRRTPSNYNFYVTYWDLDYDLRKALLPSATSNVKIFPKQLYVKFEAGQFMFTRILKRNIMTPDSQAKIIFLTSTSAECNSDNELGNVYVDIKSSATAMATTSKFHFCHYDRRVEMEANVIKPSVPVPNSATPFAEIQRLEDVDEFSYFLVINTVKFVPGSFGWVEDGACKYFQDQDLLVYNGYQLIKLDNPKGNALLKLCVNVHGFRDFGGESTGSTIVNVALARQSYQFQRRLATEDNFEVDLGHIWFTSFFYTPQQAVAMIDSIDDYKLNMHISLLTELNVTIALGLETCFKRECKGLEVQENTIKPADTSNGDSRILFRLSVTGSDMFLPSRLVPSGHKFNVTLPDPSQGTLYLVNETMNAEFLKLATGVDPLPDITLQDSDATRVKLVGNAQGVASIGAYAYSSTESQSSVSSQLLEFVPTKNYFNALADGLDGSKRYKFETSATAGINGCTNTEVGCPVQIKFVYDYEFNTTSPSYASALFSDTASIYVLGQDTKLSSNMFALPAFGFAKPFVHTVNKPLTFTSAAGLSIKLQHPDEDSDKLFAVELSSSSETGKFFVPRNAELTKAVELQHIVFKGCGLDLTCSSVRMAGYPSTIEMALSNFSWRSSTVDVVEFKLTVVQRDGMRAVSGSFFVNVAVESDDSVGIIIGGAVGGLAVLLGVLAVVYKRKRQPSRALLAPNQFNSDWNNGHTSPIALQHKGSSLYSANPSFGHLSV